MVPSINDSNAKAASDYADLGVSTQQMNNRPSKEKDEKQEVTIKWTFKFEKDKESSEIARVHHAALHAIFDLLEKQCKSTTTSERWLRSSRVLRNICCISNFSSSRRKKPRKEVEWH